MFWNVWRDQRCLQKGGNAGCYIGQGARGEKHGEYLLSSPFVDQTRDNLYSKKNLLLKIIILLTAYIERCFHIMVIRDNNNKQDRKLILQLRSMYITSAQSMYI